jgi:hypothetical protein
MFTGGHVVYGAYLLDYKLIPAEFGSGWQGKMVGSFS